MRRVQDVRHGLEGSQVRELGNTYRRAREQVRVPSTVRNLDIIDAEFLLPH